MARQTKTAKKPAVSSTVADFKKILDTAKERAPKKATKARAIDSSLFDSQRPPLSQSYSYASGVALTLETDKSGQPVMLRFSNGRMIERSTAGGGANIYQDSTAPGATIKELVIAADGSLTYTRVLGEHTADITECASGAKSAKIKKGDDIREIELGADAQKIYKGSEGVMTVAADGSLVTMAPRAGGSIQVYPWVKLVAVEFPDGHKQTFYASDREIGMVRSNAIGFYVNWLPTDTQGHHYEWGTLAL